MGSCWPPIPQGMEWQREPSNWPVPEPMPLPLEAAACLFGGTALLAGRALLVMGRPSLSGASPVNTGMQMRRSLVAFLLVANLVRCLSLVAELCFQEDMNLPLLAYLDAAQQGWLRDLIALLPAVVFLSAFSVVVLFWAQLHYTTAIVPLPLLDCLFVCVNIACYLLVAAIAVCTFLLQAYSHLRTYMICIIGFLNATVAFFFLYYGLMVVSELAETARKKLPGKRLTPRVVVLSIVCPLSLLIRGAWYIAWGLSIGRPSMPADLALCVIGEWLPSVVTLVMLSPLQRGGARSPNESVDDSTDSEAPLLQDDPSTPQRALAGGAPGLTWKQLYPQPEKV